MARTANDWKAQVAYHLTKAEELLAEPEAGSKAVVMQPARASAHARVAHVISVALSAKQLP